MTDHTLGSQPQITIDGRAFYVRSQSPGHIPVNKTVDSEYAISSGGVRRRTVAIFPKEWDYTVACRGNSDRDYILDLVNNMTDTTYVYTFQDGFSGTTYDVVVLEVESPRPVSNNLEYWDINIKLGEWT